MRFCHFRASRCGGATSKISLPQNKIGGSPIGGRDSIPHEDTVIGGVGNPQILAAKPGEHRKIPFGLSDSARTRGEVGLQKNPIRGSEVFGWNPIPNQYTVVPNKNVTVNHNKYCREYRTTADIAGKQQQVYGTACRQPDGSWKVVK